MPRKLSERRLLALVYLDAKAEVTAADLPMNPGTARRVLRRLARKGYAATLYAITDEGTAALAAAREQTRRGRGLL